jgi:glycosyltransferase involved in cell wall biosynthesis
MTVGGDMIENRTDDDGIWVIVPAYNEGQRLAVTLETLCQRYQNVVVVDDGSTDDTANVAQEQGGAWVVRHLINCGQGAALQTGIDFALQRDAKILVTFDGDGQHSVEDVQLLVEPIRAGEVEVVLGSRFLGSTVGMPRTRWLTLKAAVVFTWLFSRIRVTDAHNGLRAFSRHAAQQIRIKQNRMAHASEILDHVRRLNLPYCERPVTIRYTQGTLEKGQSGWNSLRIVGQLLLGRFVR